MIVPADYAVSGATSPLVNSVVLIIRRRVLFLAVLVACAVASIAITATRTRIYSYSTIIQIGNAVTANSRVQLEDPQSVIAKIQSLYAPLAENRLAEEQSEEVDYRLLLDNPQSSTVVVLTSKGTAQGSDRQRQFHQLITEAIEQDHRNLVDERSAIESKIARDAELLAPGTAPKREAESISPTRVLSLAVRSRKPTDSPNYTIAVVGCALGLVLAASLCFIVEVLNAGLRQAKEARS